jgi:hypothetical protein
MALRENIPLLNPVKGILSFNFRSVKPLDPRANGRRVGERWEEKTTFYFRGGHGLFYRLFTFPRCFITILKPIAIGKRVWERKGLLA